jgi:hypothetical protein
MRIALIGRLAEAEATICAGDDTLAPLAGEVMLTPAMAVTLTTESKIMENATGVKGRLKIVLVII